MTGEEVVHKGIITKYILKKGYGFIGMLGEPKRTFFFHSSKILTPNKSCVRPRLNAGELVEFKISSPLEGKKKKLEEAFDISPPSGNLFLCEAVEIHKEQSLKELKQFKERLEKLKTDEKIESCITEAVHDSEEKTEE